MCLSSCSVEPRNTKTNQFYNWWKTVHLHTWILWFVRSSKFPQLTNDDLFRAPRQKKQAITYINDAIMQSQNKNQMFTVINEYHTLSRKASLKVATDKTIFLLKKVKLLGPVISPEGIEPTAKRVEDLKNLKSPESKRDVMKVLRCLGFYSCYIKDLHLDSQPFYDLIKDSIPFHWTHEHEKSFQSRKDRISEDTILAVRSTYYSFHFHVDSSNGGTGCIPLQQFPEGKNFLQLQAIR